MLGKAIASAAGHWTWAWLVLTASPVPRWAKYPRFLVCSGFSLRVSSAGWTAGVELANECCRRHIAKGSTVKLWTWSGCRTEKLEAPCPEWLRCCVCGQLSILSPAAMRLTCESQNNRLQHLRCTIYYRLGLVRLLLAARAAAGRPSPSRFSVIAVASFDVWPRVEANGRNELQ